MKPKVKTNWASNERKGPGRMNNMVMRDYTDYEGDIRPHKGKMEGVVLAVWDGIDQCTKECPVYERCTYEKHDALKCVVQATYLRQVLTSTIQQMKARNRFNDYYMMLVGYHLMPLYSMLVKFKIRMYSMQGVSIQVSDKGTMSVHPIYKEVRQIIKDIHTLSSDIGLFSTDASVNPNVHDMVVGDSDYYTAMARAVPGSMKKGAVAGTKRPKV